MLFREGGPSHLDTFDPKRKLDELHLKSFANADEKLSGVSNGSRFYVKSPTSSTRSAILPPSWSIPSATSTSPYSTFSVLTTTSSPTSTAAATSS